MRKGCLHVAVLPARVIPRHLKTMAARTGLVLPAGDEGFGCGPATRTGVGEEFGFYGPLVASA